MLLTACSLVYTRPSESEAGGRREEGRERRKPEPQASKQGSLKERPQLPRARAIPAEQTWSLQGKGVGGRGRVGRGWSVCSAGFTGHS